MNKLLIVAAVAAMGFSGIADICAKDKETDKEFIESFAGSSKQVIDEVKKEAKAFAKFKAPKAKKTIPCYATLDKTKKKAIDAYLTDLKKRHAKLVQVAAEKIYKEKKASDIDDAMHDADDKIPNADVNILYTAFNNKQQGMPVANTSAEAQAILRSLETVETAICNDTNTKVRDLLELSKLQKTLSNEEYRQVLSAVDASIKQWMSEKSVSQLMKDVEDQVLRAKQSGKKTNVLSDVEQLDQDIKAFVLIPNALLNMCNDVMVLGKSKGWSLSVGAGVHMYVNSGATPQQVVNNNNSYVPPVATAPSSSSSSRRR